MYQRSQRYPGKNFKAADYVMPFLIMICLGIILVLGFNLWKSTFAKKEVQAAYLHVVKGNGQMKAWGKNDFFNLTNDALVMQGDEIRSSADAQIIVEFFDGTIMRMAGSGDVSFDSINRDSKTPQIDLKVTDGSVWFNMLHKQTVQTDVNVTMNHIVAHSNNASIFELQSGDEEAARVFSVLGNDGLAVDVLSEDAAKVVETENIGIGQQIVFTLPALKKYWAHQSPTVLAAIDDNFKKTDLYLWNLKEDNEPTKFEKNLDGGLVKADPQVIADSSGVVSGAGVSGQNLEPVVGSGVSGVTASGSGVVASGAVVSGAVSGKIPVVVVKKPALTAVKGSTGLDAKGRYKVAVRLATLTGTVDGADKIMVNDFTLQKFKPGDKTWTYFANADYSLMKLGENVYNVYALDSKGNKSEPLVVKVVFDPSGAKPVVSGAASGSAVTTSGSAVSGTAKSGAAGVTD